MRAAWLTGERVYVRAMLPSDKDAAVAWFPGPFPVTPARAEEFLKESITSPWQERQYFVIVRKDSERVVGGLTFGSWGGHGRIRLKAAPVIGNQADLADAMRVLVPWVREEMQLITTTFELAADETELVATAEETGLVLGARMREFVARAGHRVDLLLYQALNPYFVEREGRHA